MALTRIEYEIKKLASVVSALLCHLLQEKGSSSKIEAVLKLFESHDHECTDEGELLAAFEIATALASGDQLGDAFILLNSWCESLPARSTTRALLALAKSRVPQTKESDGREGLDLQAVEQALEKGE